MMAGIRGRDTRPELVLRRGLHARGLRFRLHRKDLPGSPDLVFPGHRVAVFVHGCFWHRHESCRYATIPKSRADFWQAKFNMNVERDRRVQKALLEDAWSVAIVWECILKKDTGHVLEELAAWIRSDPGVAMIEFG